MSQPSETEPTKSRVSVIIPVLNDQARLERCLACLAEQAWPKEQLEVIVIDNGSDQPLDATAAPYPFVTLLTEKTPGSYAARNRGLQHCTGDIIAFTDSDCLPAPTWIQEGVAAVRARGPSVVVGGRVQLFPQDTSSPTLAEDFELALGFSQQSYVEQKHYGVTANLFTTPEVFAQVGPFDQELKSGGDKEFGQRVHAAGIPLTYAETALVRHPARRSMAELFNKRKRLVGGHLGIARARHPEWLAFALVLSKACVPPVERMLKVKQKKQPRRASAAPQKSPSLKTFARVLAVGVSLQAYSALEVIRLQFGKDAER